MITPEYLDEIIKATETKTAEVNAYLTNRIIERFVIGMKKHIPSSIHDFRKQVGAGRLPEEIEKDIEAKIPDITKEARKAFMESAQEISNDNSLFSSMIIDHLNEQGEQIDADARELERVGLPKSAKDLNMTNFEIRKLEMAFRRTNGTIRNLCQSTADGTQMTFIEACDKAYMKVSHGVSVDTAICDAIEEISEKGITTIDYASGRHDRLEVAVARAVRTGINQANSEIVLTRCAEMGVNFVKVSAHIGARVTKNHDYTNHSEWQGKVYSLNWEDKALSSFNDYANTNKEGYEWLNETKEALTKVTSGYDYPDFIEVCGYGKMLGIGGINCRHTFSPFYPEIQDDTPDIIDPEENKRRYALSQKQRAMERALRAQKRYIDGLGVADSEEASKRIKEAKNKLKMMDAEYTLFCKENKLSRANWRTR